jgi:serine/threonine protein kinase
METSHVAFYSAVVLLALEHMHNQRIAYRDLKPENLLVSESGYLKLIDFGFCKTIPFTAKSGIKQVVRPSGVLLCMQLQILYFFLVSNPISSNPPP